MPRILSVPLMFLIVGFMYGQNVIQSIELIQKFKNDSTKIDSLVHELSKYVERQKGVSGIDMASGFKFKSEFLQSYVKSVLTATNQALYTALSKTIDAKTIASIKTNTNLGYNDKETYNKILEKLDSYIPKDKIDSAEILSLKKTIIANAINQFTTTLKSYTKNKEKIKSLLDYKIQFLADTKGGLNINNVFEIQNPASIKNAIKLPSENDIIDALAIFLVGRIKEESVIAFVDHINKSIDKLQPLPCLFKNTTKELASYAPGEAASFGSITQKAIALDLAQMPDNIIDCNFCGNYSKEVKKHKDFTNFFNDITGGVDLITNISYYADKQLPSNKKFTYTLQLLNFINKYYSYIYQKEKVTQTWVSPELFEDKNDSILKLSLALVYEKDNAIFDTFLVTRFSCKDLNQFFSDANTYRSFKANFKELFYSLHRLDSYWQSNKVEGKSIVDMEIYKQKIGDVFKDVHHLMNFPTDSFALGSPTYTTYLKAKSAVVSTDIQGIVYHSQQLLDLLKCYEIKLPGFKLPQLNLDFGNGLCKDISISQKEFAQLKGDSSIRINEEYDNLRKYCANSEKFTELTKSIICNKSGFRLNKCKWFNWGFIDYQGKLEEYQHCHDYRSAMNLKFHPWRHPFMMAFHFRDWKMSIPLNKIRKFHIRQIKLQSFSGFNCYLAGEQKLQNKNSFSSSRREVSQLLNFFTDLSKSNDSKQLSQIIEKYAEPVQSYRIKRFNHFSFDINAYPGVYVGVETKAGAKNVPYSKDSISSIVSGITAPIGLCFSWAGRLKFKCENSGKYPAHVNKKGNIKTFKGGSFTATIIIIDIGAVVSYRFSHDSSQALPKEVNFRQVLAPGFTFGYGIRNLPLMVSAGIQYSPQLRTFNNEGAKMLDTYRIGLSLAYDIPLLNITNTNKRSRRISN